MSEMHAHAHEEHSGYSAGDAFIALLAAVVVGLAVYAIFAALVAFINSMAYPGFTLKEIFEKYKLVVPNLKLFSFTLDWGNVRLALIPPDNPKVDWVIQLILLNLSWVTGLAGAIWGYNFTKKLPAED